MDSILIIFLRTIFCFDLLGVEIGLDFWGAYVLVRSYGLLFSFVG